MDTRRHPTPARTRATRALVIGESLIDTIQPADHREPAIERPGGSPMNVSIGLARHGVDVQFFTELGADRHGDAIEERIVREGVDLLTSLRVGTTSRAYAQLRSDRTADYEFDLEWNLPRGIPRHSPVDVVHYGSLGAAIAPGAAAVESVVRDARAASTISYDPNIRPAFETDLAATRERVARQVALSDIVNASDDDLAHLYAADTADTVADRWLAAGASIVVITRGADGMLLRSRDARIDLPGHDVDYCDTIGAGDAVTAGLLAGLGTLNLLGADRREQLRAIDARALRAIGDWAHQTALLTLTRCGAEPPTSAETRDALARAHELVGAA